MERKTLVLDNGEELNVIGESDRFYHTDNGSQYAKSNKHIISVNSVKSMYVQNVVVEEDDKEDAEEKEQETVKPKKASKKSKKEE